MLATGCHYDLDAIDPPCDPDTGACPSGGVCQLGRCLPCGAQLVPNPSFEDGISGWTPVASANLSSVAGGHDSAQAARVCPGSANWGLTLMTGLPLPPPKSYLQLSVWMRLETPASGSTVADILELRHPGNIDHDTKMPLTTDWQQFVATDDLTATPIDRDTDHVSVLIYWVNFASGGACYVVDDIDFRVCGP